jgi:hypothetical protein
MFWGKHINREPPVKNVAPNFSQQLERIRLVDQIRTRELNNPVPTNWFQQMLGLFTPEEQWTANKTNSPDLPPGLHPQVTYLDQWFSVCDVDHNNLGKYPLRSSHDWFKAWEPRCTRPNTPISTPELKIKRVLSPNPYLAPGLAGLLTPIVPQSTKEPFSNFERWDELSSSGDSNHSDSYFSQLYTWEVKTEMASFGVGKSTNSTLQASVNDLKPISPPSASNSTVSLPDAFDTDFDDINIPWEAPALVKPAMVRATGKEDADSLVF